MAIIVGNTSNIGLIWYRYGHKFLSEFDLILMMTDQLLNFKEILRSRQTSEQRKPDRHTRQMLLYLFTSTRGGFTRLRIVTELLAQPCNTHQLAKKLDLDYKAVQHHMKVLEKNNMISKIGEKYGAIFHLSNFLEINIHTLDEAIDILDKKINRKKIYL